MIPVKTLAVPACALAICLGGVACSFVTVQTASYTLGGTVSGLTGVLVLNNGSDSLTVQANGPFTFHDLVATNQSFVVSIAQQPANQTCSVANGIGTVTTVNVTNVVVSCGSGGGSTGGGSGNATGGSTGGSTGGGASTYSVGGMALGLNGNIVLQNVTANGTDVITVTADGNFTFPTLLPFGSNYAVSVVSQPTSQVCSLNQQYGSVSVENVTTITLKCTYSVGGIVRGLADSMTLQNVSGSSTTLVQVTQNGIYSFSQEYDAGAPYNVSIVSQPFGQTCQVSNGLGQVGSSDVVSVNIYCPNGQYPLGGNVSGLGQGAQVVLQNNGVVNLTLSQNGAYVIQTLTSGTPYNVTVKQQPNGQVCTVANGSGNQGNGSTANIDVTCADTANYSVGGSIGGLSSNTTLTLTNGSDTLVTSNGTFTMPTPIANGASYNVEILSAPVATLCLISGNQGTISGSNWTGIGVSCSLHLNFNNSQNANWVFGQTSFSGSLSNQGSTPAPNTVAGPAGGAMADPNGLVYLNDTQNNRVLGLRQLPTSNGVNADFILGQPTFFSNNAGAGTSGFSLPSAVSANGSQGLIVSDTGNNRVLLYPSFYGGAAMTPAIVLGQTDLNGTGTGCSASQLASPGQAIIAADKLIVADSGNNRVLIWNHVPTVSGTPADLALGQTSLTACLANRSGTVGSSTLANPLGLWSDGSALYVADTANNRVLGWSSLPSIGSDGAAASFVVGQGTFGTSGSGCSLSSMSSPTSLDSDGTTLFVSDSANNRVLLFSPKPTSGGTVAGKYLGQSSGTSCSCQHGTAGGLCSPQAAAIVGTTLVVSDTGNNRFMFFNSN